MVVSLVQTMGSLFAAVSSYVGEWCGVFGWSLKMLCKLRQWLEQPGLGREK